MSPYPHRGFSLLLPLTPEKNITPLCFMNIQLQLSKLQLHITGVASTGREDTEPIAYLSPFTSRRSLQTGLKDCFDNLKNRRLLLLVNSEYDRKRSLEACCVKACCQLFPAQLGSCITIYTFIRPRQCSAAVFADMFYFTLLKVSFSSNPYHTVKSTQAVCYDQCHSGFGLTHYLQWTQCR